MRWLADEEKWETLENPSSNEIVLWPDDLNGSKRVWKWGHERVKLKLSHLKVQKAVSGAPQVYNRNYLNQDGALPGTWWDKAQYAAGSHGTNLLSDIFGMGRQFPFPKSVYAVQDCLRVTGATPNATCLDYFSGSGTTGHAVINLNREDDGRRKYILVEMGDYFDTVLKPRIQKVVYSKDWKDGKPVSREGSSHMFKYVRLESYEDTLNNLELRRTCVQQALLDAPDAQAMREDYLLHYMLDVESRESLLPIERFAEPFDYQLKIATGSVGETKPMTVDLVETFNYLLGLRVRRMNGTPDMRVVEGADPDGARILVIWRRMSVVSNEALDESVERHVPGVHDDAFDIIYVNGDNNLENLRRDGEMWRVRLIEEEFKQRMFDTHGL